MALFGLFNSEKGYQNISAEEFARLRADKGTVVLDVRTSREYRGGHLPEARLMDFYRSFKDAVEDLPREGRYLLYCRSGARSGSACALMHRMGFKDLYNLKGGILAWKGELSR